MNPAAVLSLPLLHIGADDSARAEARERGLDAGSTGNGEFDGVVREHGRHVFNYLHRMTRHRQDAEDLTQQTFIKAYRGFGRYDRGRPVINWLLTIARRTALNHFRSSRKWEEMPEDAASAWVSPARSAEHRDDADSLWDRARRILPQRQFEVLWLRFGEELSTEATAKVVGLTQTHVKVLVFRARRALLKIRGQRPRLQE